MDNRILKIGQVYVCAFVPMPTHCTITCFGFHIRWIDGIECGLFSRIAWADHIMCGTSVLQEVQIRVTMCNCLCSVIVLCGMMMKGRETVKPDAGS